jgi:hypothetical protein
MGLRTYAGCLTGGLPLGLQWMWIQLSGRSLNGLSAYAGLFDGAIELSGCRDRGFN